MKETPSFDDTVKILMEDPRLFKEMVEINPEILEMKWSGSESLLHFLIVEKHYNEVEFLASLGAQVDSRKRVGGTPLHSVILSNDPIAVKLLLELGADPTIKNDATCDALEWAEFLDADPSIFELLREYTR